MAYDNFKPTVWSAHIQTELEKNCVLLEACNTRFQGEAGEGKRVKIIGATRPTAKTYLPGVQIEDAETPSDTSVYLDTNQYKYTHFLVDDIDEAQSVEGLMQAYMKGSAEELAEQRDAYVASLAKNATLCSASTAVAGEDAAKALIDEGFVTLWDNGVKISGDVVIEVTPWFYSLFKNRLSELYTNNVELIKKGIVGMYNGAVVKMTNNLYSDGTDDYMYIRTKNAIAFAGGISKVEAYRPEKLFSDAIKALDTFGAKIIRPKELYVVKAHRSA